MALYQITERDNGIKVGDIITAYHKGFWKVTSIEQRTEEAHAPNIDPSVNIDDPINSVANYELVCDARFKPSGKKKKKESCDVSYCKVVNEAFIREKIQEKIEEINALTRFASQNNLVSYTVPLVSLSNVQIHYAIKRVGLWLDTVRSVKSSADADHSALLYRVLSGKDPLPKPPPTKMSSPWYELGEGKKVEIDPEFDKIHSDVCGFTYVGNSGPFVWSDKEKGILEFPRSGDRFRIWEEKKKTYIQKIVEEKPFRPMEVDGKWTGCETCGSVDCDGRH